MKEQLHHRFTDEEVRELFIRYINKEIPAHYIQTLLDIRRRRFFELLKALRDNPDAFTLLPKNRERRRRIDIEIEKNITKELIEEKRLIDDPEIPIRNYNYSYIRSELLRKYDQSVSVPTIIDRAKKLGYYQEHKKQKHHDREVLTRYSGELIQHDSSHHKFAPNSQEKWYLITSLDDHSRFMLYADLVPRETTWTHILALKEVIQNFGIPYAYYVDCHSIFRFVQGRDSLHYKHSIFTDDVDPQWKQVTRDLKIKVTYALSPQAKGKIERPYQWLQDHLVRRCSQDSITDIEDAREILREEVQHYNYHQVHSTIGCTPSAAFEKANEEHKSLFRSFLLPPQKTLDDIFCLHFTRRVDAYHRISLNNLQFQVHKAPLREEVDIHAVPDKSKDYTLLRIWYKDILCDEYRVLSSDLVHF